MQIILSIACGGAIGAVLRYILSSAVQNISGSSFPYGMLVCNVLGSMLLGMLYDSFSKVSLFNDNIKLFIQVGILGSFTTFSAFTKEVLLFSTTNGILTAYFIALVITSICLLATFIGYKMFA